MFLDCLCVLQGCLQGASITDMHRGCTALLHSLSCFCSFDGYFSCILMGNSNQNSVYELEFLKEMN